MGGERVPSIIVAMALAGTLLAGCGGGSKTVTVTSSATTNAAPPTPPAAVSTTSVTATTSAPAQSATPLAQETVKESCSPGATVTIAILGLHVHGQLATLELGFTPHDPNASSDDKISLFDMTCNGTTDVTLVDPVGLKRYVVVADADQDHLEPNPVFGVQAVSGQTATGNWVFAAPPASVTSINVQVANWPTFTNVPIQR
jgi:hypothetical protein